ncbi:MAG: hypothetical protein FJZ11_06410 [Candidatus Omnitrophica bacterium]|nr:hypothetical protein [Candidatus Omnitrophota bacterium]
MTKYFKLRKETVEVDTLDISVLGVGLLSKYFIPKGVIVNLQLKINDKIIDAKGEIRSAVSWGKGLSRLGIKLIDLGESEQKIIEKFIKENERRTEPRLELS